MKLIDGSEFFIQACRTFDEVIGLDEVAELLDKMPTVEAIPIEWLEEYMVKWPSLLNAELPGVIDDWRKENEK